MIAPQQKCQTVLPPLAITVYCATLSLVLLLTATALAGCDSSTNIESGAPSIPADTESNHGSFNINGTTYVGDGEPPSAGEPSEGFAYGELIEYVVPPGAEPEFGAGIVVEAREVTDSQHWVHVVRLDFREMVEPGAYTVTQGVAEPEVFAQIRYWKGVCPSHSVPRRDCQAREIYAARTWPLKIHAFDLTGFVAEFAFDGLPVLDEPMRLSAGLVRVRWNARQREGSG